MAICWEVPTCRDDQQGSRFNGDPSDTIRRAPDYIGVKIWYIVKESISEIPCQVKTVSFA